MKKITRATALIFALSVILSQVSCPGSTKGGKITQLIGKDAQLVVLAPNLGRSLSNLGAMMDWLSAKSPMLGMMRQQMVASVGFDVTKSEELAKKGFDPSGGLAIVMINAKSEEGYGLLAVKDEKAFVAFVNEMAKKSGEPEMKKEGDYYTGGQNSVLTFKKGFAVFAKNKEWLKNVGAGKSLADTDGYKTGLKNIGSDSDVIVYMSQEFMKAAASQESGQSAKTIQDLSKIYGASTMGLSINKSEISMKGFVQLLDVTKVKKILGSAQPSGMMSKMPGGAGILARARFSLPELWTYMKDTLATSDPKVKQQMEAGLAQAGQALGMDIEKDIINNLEGNLVLAWYGMDKRRKNVSDLAAAIMVKDEAKIRAAIQKIAQMTGKKSKSKLAALGVIEITPQPGMTLYLAVVQKNLLVCTTQDRMQQAMAQMAGTTSASNAVSAILHPDAKKVLEDKNVDVLYVSARNVVDTIKKDMPPADARMMDAYLAQAGGIKDAYLLGQWTITDQGATGGIKLHLGQ